MLTDGGVIYMRRNLVKKKNVQNNNQGTVIHFLGSESHQSGKIYLKMEAVSYLFLYYEDI